MNLHQDIKLYKQAIQFTAQKMVLPEIYIEKDYWVTLALMEIYRSEFKDGIIFKGGTSLSKGYKLIHRFSEDIDLVLIPKAGETANQQKKRLKSISELINKVMPEIEVAELTRKRGMNRKTVHRYNKSFQGNYGQVKDTIVLETTCYGNTELYEIKKIESFIAQTLRENKQEASIAKYNLQAFDVKVLHPHRTMCEKIMSLVRFSYDENATNSLKQKVRHIYDLEALLSKKEYQSFMQSGDFETMLQRVATDDITSYKNDNTWLHSHPRQAFIFNKLDDVWPILEKEYHQSFSNLVYGELTDSKKLFIALKTLKERLEKIDWEEVQHRLEIENARAIKKPRLRL